jgi:peptidylprolyl isomerase
MKSTALVLCLAAAGAAYAQTAAKPAAKPAATAHPATAAAASTVKYPPGVTPFPGVPKTAFSLRYQDIKVGTGADAVPMKMYKVKYTGWRSADGVVFDSWDKHPTPVMDKDGKPVNGDDGKPKMNAPEPASFPVGMGRMIPGFDQGFTGMKVGGKRRIFIPWQLGYGAREMPDRGADHPGIPAKSDLVFDVELVEMTDLPTPAGHPGMGGGMPGAAPHPATPPSGAPPTAGATSQPSSPAPSSPAPSSPPPPSSSTTPPPQK